MTKTDETFSQRKSCLGTWKQCNLKAETTKTFLILNFLKNAISLELNFEIELLC